MIIKSDFCLKPFNTFGIEIMSRRCAQITSSGELFDLFENGEFGKQPILVIGEASNILFLDHFEGLTIMPLMRGIKIVSENDKEIIVRVCAGEYWRKLVDHAVENSWWGIENLSMIPGKVGAAPVQNIGAYGSEFKDVFVELEAFDYKSGELVNFNKEKCKFGYRDSIFKSEDSNHYIILRVTIKLSKIPNPNLSYQVLDDYLKAKKNNEVSIVDIQNAVNHIRESKLPDPEEIKNAGSFFKNPIVGNEFKDKLKSQYPQLPVYEISNTKSKLAAGWLIEQCGWKGKRIGDAGVHDNQALVIVNYANAKGPDILELANKIESSVFEKFGVKLEKEVTVI